MSSVVLGSYGTRTIIIKDGKLVEVSVDGMVEI